MTIGEIVQDMLDWYRYVADKPRMADEAEARWTNHLSGFFGKMRVDRLNTEQQRRYRSARRAEGASQTTVDSEIQVIRRAYKLALQSEPPKVTRIPKFEFVRPDNARKVFIDRLTQAKLVEHGYIFSYWMGVCVEMAFTYGWRRSELLKLRVRQIDLIDGAIRLDKTKNGDAREVPLTSSLREKLLKLVEGQSPESPLFPARSDFYEWREVCAAAGVTCGEEEGIIFHDIRRSSARNKRAAGVDTSLIMHMQGWKTEAMFRRYAIVDRTDLTRALEQEASYLQGVAS